MRGDGARDGLGDRLLATPPDRGQSGNAARYRAEGDRYAALAGATVNPLVREQLRQVAETYLRLAEQIEALPDLP